MDVKRVQPRSKDLNKELAMYNLEVKKKDQVEKIDDRVILINKQPSFFYYEGTLLPTLKFLQEHDVLKKVVVDMGAVKFVIKGADIMRPGIVDIDATIEKNECVAVLDENNKKPLAICKALYGGKEMQTLEKGKVLQNIHYIGDELWSLE